MSRNWLPGSKGFYDKSLLVTREVVLLMDMFVEQS